MANNYTREEYVYLSKLYEKAERFPDMVKSINKYVELDPKLTKEERNLLSAGYKNIISDKRSSWRLLNNLERKEEEKKNVQQCANIKEIKDKIEKELNAICDEIQSIIDKYLIPNAIDVENKVFYLKLKADYYRYKCEFANGKDFDDACANAEKVHHRCKQVAYNGCCRSFDHYADLHIRTERYAFTCEFSLDLIAHIQYLFHF